MKNNNPQTFNIGGQYLQDYPSMDKLITKSSPQARKIYNDLFKRQKGDVPFEIDKIIKEIILNEGEQKFIINENSGKILITVSYENGSDTRGMYITKNGFFECIKNFVNGFIDENGNSLNL